MELCRFDRVNVTFGAVQVLNDLTFSIDSDSGMTGIIGPNGAGKSTTLNALTGAVPLSAGKAFILGREVRRRTSPATVARYGVGRTFQIPRPFARMTVRENLWAASEAQSVPGHGTRKQQRVQLEELLKRLSLAPIADRMAGAASLAERKRIELGKALATRPRLVLLDEMFEGLSEDEITAMVALLRGLHGEGIHFIFIEHVMRALRSLADNLIVIDKGVLIASGPTAEVLQDPGVRRAYLGMGPVDGTEPAGSALTANETEKVTDSTRQE